MSYVWPSTPTGWVPSRALSGIDSGAATDIPPQYIQDVLSQGGTPWDANKYTWNPYTFDLIDRGSGGQYSFRDIPDPAAGSYVALPYGTPRAGSGGTPVENTFGTGGEAFYFGPNEAQPYFFGNPGGANELFASGNPAEISEYNHDQRTRAYQGAAQVGALVGGAAALGGATSAGGPVGSYTGGGGAGTYVSGSGDLASMISGGMGPQAALAGSGGAAAGGVIANNLPSILSGAASLLGGKLASDAAGDAVDAQVQSGREALDYQRESRDMALDIARPQLQASNVALARMLSMTGQPIPAALQESLTAAGVTDIGEFDVSDDPSYQWRLDQSMKALETGAFARGGGMSGGFAQKALRYAQDYASTEYSNIYGRLATVAGYGPVAMNTSSNSALSYGANASRTALEGGDARASGYVAQSNAWQNALDQVAKLPWDQWFGRQQPATAGA